MMLDDPDLPANTPPLHHFCRSTLVPIMDYSLEDMQAGLTPQAREASER